jgi:flagellar biosynthesis chaperone FliJ
MLVWYYQLDVARLELERRSGLETELGKAREESAEHAQRCLSLAEQLRSLRQAGEEGEEGEGEEEEVARRDKALDDLHTKLAALHGAEEKWREESEEKVKLAQEVS